MFNQRVLFYSWTSKITKKKKNNVEGHSGSTSIPNSANRVVIVLALSTAWTTVKKPTLLHSHSIQLLKVCLLLFPPVTVSMQRRPRGENKNPAKHHSSSSSSCEMLQLTLCSPEQLKQDWVLTKWNCLHRRHFYCFRNNALTRLHPSAVKTLAVKHGSASTSVSAGIWTSAVLEIFCLQWSPFSTKG